MMSDIAIVILNYNGRKTMETCLPSVVQFSDDAVIYVADNASTDDSIEWLSKNYPFIKLIPLKQNYGFAEGYNQALQQVHEPYWVLLNSDVEVTPSWLHHPIELLKTRTEIAVVQPKIKDFFKRDYFEYAGAAGGWIDNLGIPFSRGRILDTLEKDTHQYDDSCSIFWASGACFFIKKEVYEQLKGFDGDFFAHMEEIDLCWRIQRSGKQIYYSPTSEVYHMGGATLNKTNPKKVFLNFRNGLWMLHKNLPTHTLWTTIFLRLCLDGAAGITYLLKGQPAFTWAILKAHMSFYFTRNKRAIRSQWNELAFLASDKIIGWYPRSIVWDYYLKGKKIFSRI